MSKSAYYPADYIDSAGNVYPTVGENIRSGEKNTNYFGLNWKKTTIMINNGTVTESGETGAYIGGESKDILLFNKTITIINLQCAILEKNPNLSHTQPPTLSIKGDGSSYITHVPVSYHKLFIEFQYRELK